jgi:hypothetical protein
MRRVGCGMRVEGRGEKKRSVVGTFYPILMNFSQLLHFGAVASL